MPRRIRIYNLSAIFLAALISPSLAGADTGQCSARSGDSSVALLELYTSEGCSSCPPADVWLSRLQQNGLGHDTVVPLSLHVDYWNWLGWKDRFSQAKFSQRQRRLAGTNGSGTVYTPQFILNGKDFRPGGSWEHTKGQIAGINRMVPRADIQLKISYLYSRQIQISGSAHLTKRGAWPRAKAYIALFENNLVTKVMAGENTRRTLHHDYVVRELIGPLDFDDKGVLVLRQQVNLGQSWQRKHLGVAVFIQNRSNDTLQALALQFCRNMVVETRE